MEIDIGKVISVITAMIGLASTWVAYKMTVAKWDKNFADASDLVRLDNPNISISRWSKSTVWWLWGPAILLHVFNGIISLKLEIDVLPVVSFIAVAIGLFFVLPMYFQDPDASTKKAEFELLATKDDVIRKVIKALSMSGVRIGSVSVDDGLVQGKRGLTWRSWGEIIKINIEEVNGGKSRILIQSSPVEPGRLIDMGASRRNISDFQKNLIGLN
ncbi:MAG: hypothetical protein PHT49_10520 [Desulfovibrionales bacterium]|nr:hypothetical protein [Desulfovibrionales bacterium]